MRRLALPLVALLCGTLVVSPASAQPVDGRDDVTVIAVVDASFQPQHWDFSAAHLPQHANADPSDDLPLHDAPDTWLPGFPAPTAFRSYQPLALTLDDEYPDTPISALQAEDDDAWRSLRRSAGTDVDYYWIPGTKVVGAIRFGSGPFQGDNEGHGANTSSVSAGNLHGTCPECVVVLLSYGSAADGEAASRWAMRQPWIDVVTNSFGFSAVNRDRLYSGSDTLLQKEASERGQTIFFSAGNGQANRFTVPNTTSFSSQEGPDWIVTVGAVSPRGGNYTGAGKPADIASAGSDYPSIGGRTVAGSDATFGGTSNATPVVAGLYARALYEARRALDGPRLQDAGAIASGTPVECGDVRPECELADGTLTAAELRTRLFHGALRTPQGLQVGAAPVTTEAKTEETELASEGHGTYLGRLLGDEAWAAERERVSGPLFGTAPEVGRPAGEREWMVVDSYCRQSLWGTWSGGYWTEGAPVPGADPLWPLRTARSNACAELFPPLAPFE